MNTVDEYNVDFERLSILPHISKHMQKESSHTLALFQENLTFYKDLIIQLFDLKLLSSYLMLIKVEER